MSNRLMSTSRLASAGATLTIVGLLVAALGCVGVAVAYAWPQRTLRTGNPAERRVT